MPQQQETQSRVESADKQHLFRQIAKHGLCYKCVELTTKSNLCEIKPARGRPWDLGQHAAYDYFTQSSLDFSSRWYLVCQSAELKTSNQRTLSSTTLNKVISDELGDDQNLLIGQQNFVLDDGFKPQRLFQHHRYDEFKQSADNSCTLCRRFYQSIRSYARPNIKDNKVGSKPGDCRAALCFVKTWTKPNDPDGSNDNVDNLGCSILVVFVYSERIWTRRCVLVFSHDVTQLCEVENLSALLKGPEQRDSLAHVKTWLSNCRKNHSCASSTVSIIRLQRSMPRRLLKISSIADDTCVRLMDPPPANAIYGTLSHCWGSNELPLKLTLLNYDNFCRGISVEGFPRTLRETILVTSQLGIEYIWIDALCIIQDSRDDWLNEATKMPYIYGYGEINIAATASKDSEGGILVQDRDFRATGIVLNWKPLSDRTSVFANYDITNKYTQSVQKAPLNQRGWVFQEQALAPRTIHFAKDQVWVECREYCGNEIHAVPDKARIHHLAARDLAQYGWTSLVNEYSHRLLTHQRDRLVAFGGIAEIFGRARGYDSSEYYAGLWQKELPSQLLWSTIFSNWPHGARFNEYTAPSWSWATRSGQRRFDHPGDIVLDEWNQALKVLDISVSPSLHSRFGPVSHGELSISCYLHPMVLHSFGEDSELLLGISGCGYYSDHFNEARRKTREANILEGYYSDEEADFDNNLFMVSAASRRKWAHIIPQKYVNLPTKRGHVNHKMCSRDVARFHFYSDEDGPIPDLDDFRDCYFVPCVKRTRHTGNAERRHVIIGLVLAPRENIKGVFQRKGLLEVFYPFGFEETPLWWLGGSNDLGDTGIVIDKQDGICTLKVV